MTAPKWDGKPPAWLAELQAAIARGDDEVVTARRLGLATANDVAAVINRCIEQGAPVLVETRAKELLANGGELTITRPHDEYLVDVRDIDDNGLYHAAYATLAEAEADATLWVKWGER